MNSQNSHLQTEDEVQRLKSIIQDFPASIYWKDLDGVYLGWNEFAANKMREVGLEAGDSLDDVVGKTDYDMFPKDVADEYQKNDQQVMNTGRVMTKEEQIRLPEGRVLTQLSIKRPLLGHSKKIIGIVGYTIDITDQKEMDDLKHQLLDEQRRTELFRLLGGSIAHELRTPLATINEGLSTLFYYQAKLRGKLGTYLEQSNEVEKILQSVGDLLGHLNSAAKSSNMMVNMFLMNIKEGGISSTDFSNYPIKAAVNEALSMYPFLDGERDIVHPHLDHSFDYFGDDLLTRHLLFNLIKNSLHSIKKAGKGQVTITTCKNEGHNILVFEDTGSGINEEGIMYAFERLYSQTPRGTGLGLAFCKLIMDSYGGSIKLSGKEGEFAKFELRFPSTEGF